MSNLCNFLLFASNNKGNGCHRKFAKLPGGKNVNEPINSLFRVFKSNFSKTARCIGLKFPEITEIVLLFQRSCFNGLIKECKAYVNAEKM